MTIDLFHITGTYWVQIAVRWGVPSAVRAEFLVSADSSAKWLGIEVEPSMAKVEEKIWWEHVL